MKLLTLILVSLALVFTGCSKEEPDPSVTVGSQPVQVEGYWVDDDAWRVSATGFAGEENLEKPQVQRREMACTAARLSAMSKAMIELSRADSASLKSDKVTGDMDETRFSGFIRNGSVIEKTFNADSNTCDIIFEIREPGLRKKTSLAPSSR